MIASPSRLDRPERGRRHESDTAFGIHQILAAAAPGDAVTAGARIPDTIELHSFPAEVYREAPGLKPYRYIRVGARVYAVDPRDRIVVEEIN